MRLRRKQTQLFRLGIQLGCRIKLCQIPGFVLLDVFSVLERLHGRM
jgi:hypothetical protein